MEKTTNYNNWVFRMFKDYVGKRVLDIGSGHGTFLNYIKEKELVVSIEPSIEGYGHLKRTFANNDNILLINGEINDDKIINSVISSKIDTVICLNVLEHIKEDNAAISNIRKCLPLGGRLILYVPAIKMIYGTLDMAVGHYRRYDKRELEAMLRNEGFKVLKSRYVNFIGAFSWFLYSRVLKRTIPAEKRILFYDKYVVPIVSMIEFCVRLPFGQSILIICEAVEQ